MSMVLLRIFRPLHRQSPATTTPAARYERTSWTSWTSEVWLGFHFRFADIASRNLALQLSDWTINHYFQSTHDH
jgi:hypothetical protein